MVYYRKYRPQQIADLDSQDVRIKLHSVLSTAAPTFLQVPHAFLFTGPKGLGKTSTARIVAKVINCTGRKDTSGKDIEPCNTCEQCISITNGTNLDVFEIDAASNRGIDEIRDLKEKIRLAPVSSKKKVYIIDEVHMLTTEAFNALLKTLEEPPTHAVFILCTTESHKIPATILSRCFHLSFKRATEEELVRAFQRIVKGEQLKVDEAVLHSLAQLADGGFRDGTKMLEELVALSQGGNITQETLDQLYNVSSLQQKLTVLLQALEEKDTQKGIGVISEYVNEGGDMSYLLQELVSSLHALFLQKVGVVQETQCESSLDIHDLKVLLELCSKASSEMKYAVVSSLPLEMMIVSWCQGVITPRATASVDRPQLSSSAKKDDVVTVQSLRKQAGDLAKIRAVTGETKDEKSTKVKGDPSEVSILSYAATGDHSKEWMDALWKNIIIEIKNHNHMIAGVLRSCRLLSYDRKELQIEAAAKFHKEKLEEAKTFQALHEVCEQLIGNPVTVTIVLKA